jgi:hypothetical protein
LPFGQIDEADCAQRVVHGLRVGFAETPPDAEKSQSITLRCGNRRCRYPLRLFRDRRK